jgi:HAD superfamily hydrolase (TIGR01509 family)
MIQTIIFDFAGVLTKSRCFPLVAERLSKKFNVDKELIQKRLYSFEGEYLLGNKSTKTFWGEVCKDLGVPLRAFAKELASWYALDKQMIELVSLLKKDYQVILLSDNFDAGTIGMRKNKTLNRLFEKMYFSNELHSNKKNAKTFNHVLKDIARKPQECLFIDDKEENLKVPKKIGFNVILFKNSAQFKREIRTVLKN